MSFRRRVAVALANAFLAGEWSARGMKMQAVQTLGGYPPWASRAARRSLQAFPAAPLDRRDDLARFLLEDEKFRLGRRQDLGRPLVRRWFVHHPAMGPHAWDVPKIATVGQLASWLGVEGKQLEWFADRRGLERTAADEPLRHYTYRWLDKRAGGIRLIESPKAQLKAIQRRILHGILDRIPAHDAAHGFRRGRSVVTFAAPHAGHAIVLRLDLCEFFASVTRARVYGIFRTAGYPEEVARTLADLCTNRTSRAITRTARLEPEARRRIETPHLPQGAPTSPALANLSAFRLDVRLSALAEATGGHYSRYADDLALSFTKAVDGDRLVALSSAIALEEGFAVNFRKVRQMSAATRQRLAGVVVNVRPNIARRDFDRLKAVLHNCRVHGPSTQDREGTGQLRQRLQGQVAWASMVNPDRGAQLQALFDEIDWCR